MDRVHSPETRVPRVGQSLTSSSEAHLAVQNGAGTNKRQPQPKAGGEASPMGNFTTGQRPSLVPRASKAGTSDDVSLGPGRTMFPSSRNVAKLSDFADKQDGGSADEQDGLRSKFFSERQSNRKSMNDKDGEATRDSWTTVRERRALGREEPDGRERHDRYGRRERDQDGDRRNGNGEKTDGRWGERRQNGERTGGWRDRERRKEEWTSGGPVEKAPEWMDDPAPGAVDDDMGTVGMSKRAEDFQRWKDERKMREAQAEGNTAELESTPLEPPQPSMETATSKVAKLQIDGLVDKSFGGWGETSSGVREGASTPLKVAQASAKAKASRFASMFKDNQAKEDAFPMESTEARPSLDGSHGNAEDEAGFKRILQMLGNTNVSQTPGTDGPSSPPGKPGSQSMRQKSRFTGFFDQTPKSPDRILSPSAGPPGLPKPIENDFFRDPREAPRNDRTHQFGGQLHDHIAGEPPVGRGHAPAMSSDAANQEPGHRDQRPTSGHISNLFLEQPPSRGAATPDINIQNLLAGQRSQRPQGPDKNSEFLLNLLQNKGSSRPPSQQARPDSNFPLWLDQPPHVAEPHAPKARAPPPPGLFEDQLMRDHPQEPSRPDQKGPLGNDVRARQPQRAPPGFFDEQGLYLQQQQQQTQRRSYVDLPQQQQQPPPLQPNRRMGGQMAPPQMQISGPHGQFNGALPPEFLQSTGAHQPPPPGFNSNLPRHPPGFSNVPNAYQQPPAPQHGRDGLPPGPLGFPGAGGMMPPPLTSPLNAPPGFFSGGAGAGVPGVPPGFMHQLRSPSEGMGPAMRGGLRGYEGAAFDGAMGGARQ